MPITDAVHAILFEGLAPADAVGHLMERDPKLEGAHFDTPAFDGTEA